METCIQAAAAAGVNGGRESRFPPLTRRIEGKSSDWVLGHVRAGQEVFEAEITAAGFEKVGEEKGLLEENYFVRFRKVEGKGAGDTK